MAMFQFRVMITSLTCIVTSLTPPPPPNPLIYTIEQKACQVYISKDLR